METRRSQHLFADVNQITEKMRTTVWYATEWTPTDPPLL